MANRLDHITFNRAQKRIRADQIFRRDEPLDRACLDQDHGTFHLQVMHRAPEPLPLGHHRLRGKVAPMRSQIAYALFVFNGIYNFLPRR